MSTVDPNPPCDRNDPDSWTENTSPNTWKDLRPLPLSRHLNTIGIGEVFLCPPPKESLYSYSGEPASKDDNTPIETWEILGVLKSLPEDFVVREMGGVHPADLKETKNIRTADLTDSITLPTVEEMQSIEKEEKNEQHKNANVEEKSASIPRVQCATPFDALKKILTDCISDRSTADPSGSVLLNSIQNLASSALLDIEIMSKGSQDSEPKADASQTISTVIIPDINDNVVVEVDGSTGCRSSVVNMNMNRSTFHRSLKVVFPLLKTSTMMETESAKYNDLFSSLATDKDSDFKKAPRLIRVQKDVLFHSLIPFLAAPKEDLLSLYQFRNKGCSPPKSMLQSDGRPKKRKRGGMKKRTDMTDINPNDEVLLRLKSNLPREKRKDIHLLIAEACRAFETGTRNDISLPDSDLKTTAIVIRWSQQTRRNAISKLKRNSASATNGNQQNELPPHTLCILKKRNQEHNHAINHLLPALKCRSSDVGIAGIKDMRAITYQFCTLRNISPRRARKANLFLKDKGIELGNFERVKWLLNKGLLEGNQFEITIRDLKTVKILRRKEGDVISIHELSNPCYEKHFNDMIARVRKDGFVNFFGEQRIGNAGSTDEIGFRPMDIGKEMLKANFSKAIDLLMNGRTKCRSGRFVESDEIRKFRSTWKETDGDIDKSLLSLPKGRSLIRERAILQGLKRYGTDKPLLAIRCLTFNERIFWINAYQSYVWNLMATERILRLGPRPAKGDLFLNEEGAINIVSDPTTVCINQIVMPLPGYNIRYPSNIIGTMYEEILLRDNIKFERNAIPESSAKGSYRHLIISPEDIKVKEYTRKDRNIITTASLQFSLPSGSYATMLLREMMVSILSR